MNFTEIWNRFSSSYFTQPMLAISELAAIIIGIVYCRNDKFARPFIAFLLIDIIALLTDWYFTFNHNYPREFVFKYVKFTNTIITIAEISAYYYFFSSAIKYTKKRGIFLIPPILFAITAIISNVTNSNFLNLTQNHLIYIIYSFELVLLLPPTIVFLFQLINTNYETALFSRPSFWISVGIFFQSIISIPSYLLISYFLKQKTEVMNFIEATLFYTPLIINTLFISKAFLCKKTLTT
jgi:hypothetical protein